ncbi:MAG TPA: hypothetical protein PLQ19_03835 [Aeromicrobium sp.]|nr:hypothetical protein [Aeromicrobium sp.]
MGTALLFGLGSAVPLVLGAWIGMRFALPKAALAALMAFGGGTMIAAASEELFGPAFAVLPAQGAGLALMLGAATYVVANHLLDTRLGASAVGVSLMLGAVLDGIPENIAMGVSISAGGGLVLLVAIAIGNVPEAIGSAATLRDDPKFGQTRALVLWSVVALILVAVTVAAHAGADQMSPSAIAIVQAFAGGATIAVLADTLLPEAYRDGGWWVGIATAAGFYVAYLLG